MSCSAARRRSALRQFSVSAGHVHVKTCQALILSREKSDRAACKVKKHTWQSETRTRATSESSQIPPSSEAWMRTKTTDVPEYNRTSSLHPRKYWHSLFSVLIGTQLLQLPLFRIPARMDTPLSLVKCPERAGRSNSASLGSPRDLSESTGNIETATKREHGCVTLLQSVLVDEGSLKMFPQKITQCECISCTLPLEACLDFSLHSHSHLQWLLTTTALQAQKYRLRDLLLRPQ
jgi:hypothetical protein